MQAEIKFKVSTPISREEASDFKKLGGLLHILHLADLIVVAKPHLNRIFAIIGKIADKFVEKGPEIDSFVNKLIRQFAVELDLRLSPVELPLGGGGTLVLGAKRDPYSREEQPLTLKTTGESLGNGPKVSIDIPEFKFTDDESGVQVSAGPTFLSGYVKIEMTEQTAGLKKDLIFELLKFTASDVDFVRAVKPLPGGPVSPPPGASPQKK
jgi:hypothetical protein